MVNEERILDDFLYMVKISSVSKAEGKFARYIIEKLRELGAEVYVDNAGEKAGCDTGNVIAKIRGNDQSKRTILFSAHMDTVVPGVDIKPVIKDGIIYSDGTTILGSDDKCGIASIMEMLRCIKEDNISHGDIEIVLSVSEEIGLLGAKNLDYSMISAKIAYILDSGGSPGLIVNAGPAQDSITITIHGKASHAGLAPEAGISAIMVASDAISNMKLLRIDNETTANIGTIEGGAATNIVPDKVDIKAEARSLKNEKLDIQTAHMVDCFTKSAEKFGAKVDVRVERMYPAFFIPEDSYEVQIVKRACENISLPVRLESSGGGSDANIFNGNGISALNLAVGIMKPHTLEEYIKIEDLVNTAKMLIEIVKEA